MIAAGFPLIARPLCGTTSPTRHGRAPHSKNGRLDGISGTLNGISGVLKRLVLGIAKPGFLLFPHQPICSFVHIQARAEAVTTREQQIEANILKPIELCGRDHFDQSVYAYTSSQIVFLELLS